MQPGINRILHYHGVAGAHQHAVNEIQRLLAAAGHHYVVITARHSPLPSLFQQMLPQRPVARRRPQLQDVRCGRTLHHLTHSRPEISHREEILGRRRSGETDS